jgi:hypothetical protein
MKRDTSLTKFTAIFRHVFPASLTDVSADYCQIALVDESGKIRTQMGTQKDQKWSQCLGRLVRYHPVTITVTVTNSVNIMFAVDLFNRTV